ncbi:hypothetical protein C8Q74DRAFT_393872 [Fomes fomentarius]|nr:hypothetical protein C8Q74DRAFT_393872 [Fomes fomentarius]
MFHISSSCSHVLVTYRMSRSVQKVFEKSKSCSRETQIFKGSHVAIILRSKALIKSVDRGNSQQSTPTLSQLCGLPHYMALNRDRRRALIKLVASEHPYAVQTLRHTRPPVPRNWRVCRFCRRKGAVETEKHIIFGCSSPLLLQATDRLLEEMQQKHPNIRSLCRTLPTAWSLLEYLMGKPDLLALFADHVVWTYAQCKHTQPLRIGSQAEYDNL